MRHFGFILLLPLVYAILPAQSVQKQAFQEIRADTIRPNHYGPVWGIVLAWHDSVRVRIFRDSMDVKNISGDTARFKYYAGAFTYDTLNHNSQFSKDTLYRAAQEAAIRAIIEADTLYRAAQEVAIRSVQAADSTYKTAQIALKFPKDSVDTDATLAANTDTRVPSQRAIKEYVDLAVSSLSLKEYLTSALSATAGKNQMTDTLPTANTSLTSLSLSAGTGQLLRTWITNAGSPGLNRLLAGVYELHLHAAVSGVGPKDTKFYWELWKYTVAPDSTKLVTGEISPSLTTSQAEYTTHGDLAAMDTILTTDRLMVKLYANVTGGGGGITMSEWFGGTSDSHFGLPVSPSDLTNIFMQYKDTADTPPKVATPEYVRLHAGGSFSYDTLNHNSQFAKDSLYRAAQEAAIRAIIQADSLYRVAQEAIRWLKSDSASTPGIVTINRLLDSLAHVRSSMNAIGGGTAYDTLNHNSQFAKDTTYKAAQDAAIRAVQAADSLYRAAQESAIRAVQAADSLYRAAQEAAIQAVQAADSSYKATQLLLRRLISDTTATAGTPTINRLLDSLAHVRTSMNAIGGGATDSTIFMTVNRALDSLNRVVHVRDSASVYYSFARTRDSLAAIRTTINTKLGKADSAATTGFPTINRLLDSLGHVRSSMNAIGSSSSSFFNPATTALWHEEFYNSTERVVGSDTLFGDYNWVRQTSKTGTAALATPVADHPGGVTVSSGNVAITYTHFWAVPKAGFMVGNQDSYTIEFALKNVAAAASNAYFRVGMWAAAITTANGNPVNGIYFRADDAGNWFAITRASAAETATDCTVAQSTNFQDFKIVANATADTVRFYIDGTLRATNTGHIPTVAVGPVIFCGTTAGTNRQLTVDYYTFMLQSVSR